MQNRNISENIRTLIDIMEYLKKENRPGIIINVDFEKAFDSAEWPFIKLALKKFNMVGNPLLHILQHCTRKQDTFPRIARYSCCAGVTGEHS